MNNTCNVCGGNLPHFQNPRSLLPQCCCIPSAGTAPEQVNAPLVGSGRLVGGWDGIHDGVLYTRFPLRENMDVKLTLPINITMSEARRINAFLETLILPEDQAPNNSAQPRP
jgi:hypothetical protein